MPSRPSTCPACGGTQGQHLPDCIIVNHKRNVLRANTKGVKAVAPDGINPRVNPRVVVVENIYWQNPSDQPKPVSTIRYTRWLSPALDEPLIFKQIAKETWEPLRRVAEGEIPVLVIANDPVPVKERGTATPLEVVLITSGEGEDVWFVPVSSIPPGESIRLVNVDLDLIRVRGIGPFTVSIVNNVTPDPEDSEDPAQPEQSEEPPVT